ncbi:HAD-IA family hydrolase [Streptomyces sp. NPDC091266]|uniref:HAD-IA family hydrolase n=1 Tax=Streptomyces sp. NPDC091266 TaxID=3365978 RepID=UPI0037F90AEE
MNFSAEALLFDSDETLVSALASVYSVWVTWAEEHGLTADDLERVEKHGRPAAEVMRDLLPAERIASAKARLEEMEIADAEAGGVTAIPGAQSLLESLPAGRWAVVTSGSRSVAEARLGKIGVQPAVLVTSGDITRGKPHPEPFLLAAKRLGVAPESCIVFEDAPAGLTAAKAAGMRTIAVTSTHGAEELDADVVVSDLSHVEATENFDGSLSLTVVGK